MVKVIYRVKFCYNELWSEEVEYDMSGKDPITFSINQKIDVYFSSIGKNILLFVKNVEVKNEQLNDATYHHITVFTSDSV